MSESGERTVTRRGIVRGAAIGALATVALAAPGVRSSAMASAQDSASTPVANVTADGIGGGGMVPNGAGKAQFGLTAFAVAGADGAEPTFHGSFMLKDLNDPVNPVDMASEFFNQITAFSKDHPNARQIIGWAKVNGGGPYPFLLQVEDLGTAGSGEDTFNLVFGNDALPFLDTEAKKCDCGGFTYTLRGKVAEGDLVLFPLGS